MAKQIRFSYKDVEYTLEFTRKSLETMERQGFIPSEVTEKPMSTLPALFAGAFLAHHRYLKKEIVDEIFAHLSNKQELIGKLVEMYNEPILSLIEDNEDGAGNADWTASW